MTDAELPCEAKLAYIRSRGFGRTIQLQCGPCQRRGRLQFKVEKTGSALRGIDPPLPDHVTDRVDSALAKCPRRQLGSMQSPRRAP